MSDFAVLRTCRECPWKTTSVPGKFAPERYRKLRRTCEQSLANPVFACHMSPEGEEKACAGFLLVEGVNNILVRIAAAYGRFSYDDIKADGPLYESFAAMARANGYDPEDD